MNVMAIVINNEDKPELYYYKANYKLLKTNTYLDSEPYHFSRILFQLMYNLKNPRVNIYEL